MANYALPLDASRGVTITQDNNGHDSYLGDNHGGNTNAFDLAYNGAPSPSGPAYAITDGTVHHAPASAYGSHVVWLEGNDGYAYYYAHMSAWAADGDKVKAGEQIGTVGSETNAGGISTGNHLHITMDQNPHSAQPASINHMANGAQMQKQFKDMINNLLAGHGVAHVDAPSGLSTNSLAGLSNAQNGQGVNMLPQDLPNIVPSYLAYVYGGKVYPMDWNVIHAVNYGYSGTVSGNVSVHIDDSATGIKAVDGVKTIHLEKILFLNYTQNVVGEVEIDQEVKEGDIMNIDANYSLQKFVDCSILTKEKAKELLDWMTDVALGWKDDGSSAQDSYDKLRAWYEANCGTQHDVPLIDEQEDTAADFKRQFVQALRRQGFDSDAVKAIVANVYVESAHTFNPAQIELGHCSNDFVTAAHQGNCGVGLVQWTGSRAVNLLNFAASKNQDPKSMDLQVDFLHHELVTGYQEVSNAMASKTLTLDQKVAYWVAYFEKPFDIPGQIIERQAIARTLNIDDIINGTPQGASSISKEQQQKEAPAAVSRPEPRPLHCDTLKFVRR